LHDQLGAFLASWKRFLFAFCNGILFKVFMSSRSCVVAEEEEAESYTEQKSFEF
jgi:hypothetical protein